MTNYDVKRLGMILSVQAEIEGMKAANSQYSEDQPYTEQDFINKSVQLLDLANAHDEQL